MIDLKRHLDLQIDAILASDPSPTQDIIVRMGAAETEDQAIVAAISEAIRSRTLATSARDVLPVPARTLGPAGERMVGRQRQR